MFKGELGPFLARALLAQADLARAVLGSSHLARPFLAVALLAQAIPERVRSGADLKIGRRPVTWDWSKGGITQPECGGPWVHSRSLLLSCSLIGSSVLRTLSRRAQRSEQLLAPRTRPCPVGVWHRFELTRSLPDLHTLQIRPSDVRLCVSDHGNQASESGSFQNPPDPSSSRTSFWRVRLRPNVGGSYNASARSVL